MLGAISSPLKDTPLQPPPERGPNHAALDCFLGAWQAEGTSFGGTNQSGDPKANGDEWLSVHTAKWHTGSFFLFQDERATISGKSFDTLSVFGVDPNTGDYFARTFENHGFYRHYQLARHEKMWTLTGATERAQTEFSEDGRTQLIKWEWKPKDHWLPLCDRTAVRID